MASRRKREAAPRRDASPEKPKMKKRTLEDLGPNREQAKQLKGGPIRNRF